MAFCRGNLQRGIELMIHAAGLKHRLNGAAFCITGEGSVDHSSQFGKTAVGVAKTCQELGVPTFVLAGGIGPGARAVLEHGVSAYFDITPRPCTLEQALAGAADALADTAEQVVRLYRVAHGKD
jgi:glycerate kinase